MSKRVMHYDAVPTYDCEIDSWMLHVVSDDDDWNTILVGPCGGTTYEHDELPTHREQVAWWIRYWRYVMESGKDPLEQIIYTARFSDYEYETSRLYRAAFVDTQNGIFVYGANRSGHGWGEWVPGDKMDNDFQSFFNIADDNEEPSSTPTIKDIHNMYELRRAIEKCPERVYVFDSSAPYLPTFDLWGVFLVGWNVSGRRETEAPPEYLIKKATEFYKDEMKEWNKLRSERTIEDILMFGDYEPED